MRAKAVQIKEIEKEYLSTREAMKLLDCSADLLERLRNDGEIACVRYGAKSIWYIKASIDQFMRRHLVGEWPAGLIKETYRS